MIPPSYSPTDPSEARYVRALSAIMTHGWNVADQGIALATRWNSDVTMRVRLPDGVRPRAVVVLSARLVSAPGSAYSCVPVAWSADGSTLTISTIGTLTASVDYDLEIWVVT